MEVKSEAAEWCERHNLLPPRPYTMTDKEFTCYVVMRAVKLIAKLVNVRI